MTHAFEIGQEQIASKRIPLEEPIHEQFRQILRSHAFFTICFFILGSVEVILLLSFFTFFVKSAWLALCFGLIFFTIFAYFILRLYYLTKKSEQLEMLKDQYIQLCSKQSGFHEGQPELYIALSNACTKLAHSISGIELTMYFASQKWKIIHPFIKKISRLFHWQDVHRMKEILFYSAVEQHIKLVKAEPINLKAHAALANAYVNLSSLYANPRSEEDLLEERIFFPDKLIESFKKKYREAAKGAIEEFKILLTFAPNDPWVHLQLAYSYHDLNMPLEEIGEYEALLKFDPDNIDYLSKIGLLYFQQGLNAQGLGIFEKLKKRHPQKANHLISHYGAYNPARLS